MRPLIFEFAEQPSSESMDFSIIEYDNNLNLSIVKSNGLPAIECLDMETETFTKTQYESSDSDRDSLRFLMDTETRTFTQQESSDSDRDRVYT